MIDLIIAFGSGIIVGGFLVYIKSKTLQNNFNLNKNGEFVNIKRNLPDPKTIALWQKQYDDMVSKIRSEHI